MDGGDVVLDFGTQRQHLLLAAEQRQEFLEPLADGNGFEQLLAVFEAQVQVRGDEVGEMAGMIGVERGDFDLVGQRGGHLGDFIELLVRVAQHRLQFDGIFRLVAQEFVGRAEVRRGRREIFHADAPETLDQHARGAVGKFHHLGQARDAADLMQILRGRLGDLRLALQHRRKQAVAGHDVVNQLQARTGLDEQRHDGAGKNHDVGKAEDGQRVRQRPRRDARRRFRLFSGAENADKFRLRRCGRRIHQLLNAAALEKNHARSNSIGNRHLGCLGLRLMRRRHVNPQKTVHVNGLGPAQIIARRQVQHAFKRAVADFHD